MRTLEDLDYVKYNTSSGDIYYKLAPKEELFDYRQPVLKYLIFNDCNVEVRYGYVKPGDIGNYADWFIETEGASLNLAEINAITYKMIEDLYDN